MEYHRDYTPERITSLADNEIFVFGSNLAGAHAGGAARLAYDRFGAVWGEGVGLHGQTYHPHDAGWRGYYQTLCGCIHPMGQGAPSSHFLSQE